MSKLIQPVHMSNLRTYGQAPFVLAVIHGGPGAPGDMAPVARELANTCGVLEPLQTAISLEGQIQELRVTLEQCGDLPVILLGHSWGAWLSYLVAARYPAIVKKLILVSSGPFEAHYADDIRTTRYSRLNSDERAELKRLLERIENLDAPDRDQAFARFGQLFERTDAYDPLPHKSEVMAGQADQFRQVWQEAAELRRRDYLLDIGKHITCPVIAIHGDFDPHPAEGVEHPLSLILQDFRFILLPHCGHKPWIERQARETFYQILRDEL